MPSPRTHARTLAHQPSSVHQREHPAPFLYVSGHLNPTAQGIVESISYRGYDVDVYDYQSGAFFGIALPIGKSSSKKRPELFIHSSFQLDHFRSAHLYVMLIANK